MFGPFPLCGSAPSRVRAYGTKGSMWSQSLALRAQTFSQTWRSFHENDKVTWVAPLATVDSCIWRERERERERDRYGSYSYLRANEHSPFRIYPFVREV